MTGNARHRSKVLGAAILGLVFALNEWTVGHLLTRDGTVDDPLIRAALRVFDVVLVVVGLWFMVRRKPIDRKAVLFRCVAVIMCVIVLEGVLHVVHFVEQRAQEEPIPKYSLSPYEGKEWAKQLFAESDDVQQEERRFSYHPFLGWDTEEFHGRFVNVNSEGVREGWNPEFSPGKKVPSVYMFGGSTIWGVGVRDDYTIPSCLSKLLDFHGRELVVYNYGDIAYSFTQELINLILLLKEGHRPNYVVFYDGVNDVYAAYRHGVSGRVLDCFGTRERFGERMRPIDHFLSGAKMLLVRRCMIYHYVSRLNAASGGTPKFREAGARFDDRQLRRLAQEIADYYATSQQLLEPLSQAYGFEYMTFWQPVALTEEHLLEEERNDIRTRDESLRKAHKYVLDLLNRKRLRNFYDLSGTLRDRMTTTYIDYCHLTEEGNAVIASKICDVLESKLDAQHEAASVSTATRSQ